MKQALTEALAVLDDPANMRFTIKQIKESRRTVNTAARLVEGLLPGECEVCEGTGEVLITRDTFPCRSCHDGRVWDEGIVEAVAKAIHPWDDNKEIVRERARAVLSALVELLTEKVEK